MAKRDIPIDQFIKDASDFSEEAQKKYKEYKGRRSKETQLWQQWHETGRPADKLTPIVQSLRPLIQREAHKRLQGLGGSIPRSAIENELTNAAVKQLHTYSPERGALSTHVSHGFRRISDFVNANRNAKYMPSDDMKRFDQFRNASAELEEELGRPPSPTELRTKLPQWNTRAIQRMQRGFGKELYTDTNDGVTLDSAAPIGPRDAFQLARSQLTEQEQQFGKMYFPPEGEKQPAIRNIANALGISTHRAYRLKARVETHVGKILKRE